MRALHFAIAACLGLAACSTSNTENDFLCPAQTGKACTTIGESDGQTSVSGSTVSERPSDTLSGEISQQPLGVGKGSTGTSIGSMGDGGAPYNAAAYRQPERVGTLWVAPRRDADGLLYEATFVHFVVAEARWTDR